VECTSDYLLHQIRLNIKHPKFLALTKLGILLKKLIINFEYNHYKLLMVFLQTEGQEEELIARVPDIGYSMSGFYSTF
jgi:hypothetical protein